MNNPPFCGKMADYSCPSEARVIPKFAANLGIIHIVFASFRGWRLERDNSLICGKSGNYQARDFDGAGLGHFKLITISLNLKKPAANGFGRWFFIFDNLTKNSISVVCNFLLYLLH